MGCCASNDRTTEDRDDNAVTIDMDTPHDLLPTVERAEGDEQHSATALRRRLRRYNRRRMPPQRFLDPTRRLDDSPNAGAEGGVSPDEVTAAILEVLLRVYDAHHQQQRNDLPLQPFSLPLRVAPSMTLARLNELAASYKLQGTDPASPPPSGGDTPSSDVDEEADAQWCAVCMSRMETGSEVRLLPCMHHFHRDCVDPWLLHHKTECPVCRTDIRSGSAFAEGLTMNDVD